MTLCSPSLESPNVPKEVLHDRHNPPLNCPVLGSWSIWIGRSLRQISQGEESAFQICSSLARYRAASLLTLVFAIHCLLYSLRYSLFLRTQERHADLCFSGFLAYASLFLWRHNSRCFSLYLLPLANTRSGFLRRHSRWYAASLNSVFISIILNQAYALVSCCHV